MRRRFGRGPGRPQALLALVTHSRDRGARCRGRADIEARAAADPRPHPPGRQRRGARPARRGRRPRRRRRPADGDDHVDFEGLLRHGAGNGRDRADGRGGGLHGLSASPRQQRRSIPSSAEAKAMKTLKKSFALLLLLAGRGPAGAQSLTGTVSGTVNDEQGGALPGRHGHARPASGHPATTVSDARGEYRFTALDPGHLLGQRRDDRLPQDGARQHRGHRSARRLSGMFTLKVGGKEESIEVLGESPVVDVTSSATNNNLSQDLLFNIPDPLRERRDRPAQLRCPASTTAPPTAATPVRQRAADRRRGHARPVRRHGLDLLQLQHRPGSAGPGHRRTRRVRRLHGRRRSTPSPSRAATATRACSTSSTRTSSLAATTSATRSSGRTRRCRTRPRPTELLDFTAQLGGPHHQGQAVLLRERAALPPEAGPDRPPHAARRGEPALQRQAHLAAEPPTTS